jgi:hypothetical protein
MPDQPASGMSVRRLSAEETERARRSPGSAAHPLCGIIIGSSWHEPVACAYPPGHTGDHSWASIPALPPTLDLARLHAEIERVTTERDDYRYWNERVRVCEHHTVDVAAPVDDCLICTAEAAEAEIERQGEALEIEATRREALQHCLERERALHREAQEVIEDLAFEGRIKGWGDPGEEIHDPTGSLARARAALAQPRQKAAS